MQERPSMAKKALRTRSLHRDPSANCTAALFLLTEPLQLSGLHIFQGPQSRSLVFRNLCNKQVLRGSIQSLLDRALSHLV